MEWNDSGLLLLGRNVLASVKNIFLMGNRFEHMIIFMVSNNV